MKHRRLTSLFLTLALVATLLPPASAAEPGTENSPHPISTAADLELLRGVTDGVWFELVEDIVLKGNWPPIGSAASPFQGRLLGNGHTVSGLCVTADAAGGAFGLFGCIGESGAVERLNVSGAVTVSADNTVSGGLAGLCLGRIQGCTFVGNITVDGGSSSYVGGLVGRLGGASGPAAVVRDSLYSGEITSRPDNGQWIGGVAGEIAVTGGVYNSGAYGRIRDQGKLSGTYVGGVAGSCNGPMENCWHWKDLLGPGLRTGGAAGTSQPGLETGPCYWQKPTNAVNPVGDGSGSVTGGEVDTVEALSENLNEWAAAQPDGSCTWEVQGDKLVPVFPAQPDPPSKESGSGSVTCADVVYGQTPAPEAQSDSNGTAGVLFRYRARNGAEWSATPPEDAGDYVVEAAFPETDGYLACAAEAEFAIQKAQLTVAAKSHTVYVGDPLPAFKAEFEGFVRGEDEGALDGALAFACDGTTDQAGVWDITPSGLTARNYEITFRPGVLTVSAIGPAPQESCLIPAPTGAEGWYTAPFTIAPAAGYQIAETPSGPFTRSEIPISEETADGVKQIYLLDDAGRKYSASIPYKLDSTPPAVKWSETALALDGAKWYPSAEVSATAADVLSGVAHVTLEAVQNDVIQEREDSITLAEPGSYQITAKAADNAGNLTALGPITVNIDPIISVFSEKTAVLTDSDPFSTVKAVKDWYTGLNEGQKAHISASDAGITALEQLNTLFDSFTAPEITGQPQNLEATYGEAAGVLQVSAAGKNLSYQWYQNGELMPGKTETELLLPQNLPAGAYRYRCSVRAGRDGPETLSGEATVTITPRPLTVRAASHTIYIGDELPEFTAEYEGFAPNEDVSVLTGTLSFSCGADSSRAGAYAIELSGLSGENYQITFQPGVLTVLDAAPAPRESYVLPTPDGEEGWYTAPFSIAPAAGYQISETPSGPFSASGIPISEETADGVKRIYLLNDAGKKYSTSIPYKLDSTPPAVAWGQATLALDGAKWYPSAEASATAADVLSGVAHVTLEAVQNGATREREDSITLTEPGSYQITAKAADRAGNLTALGPILINIDPIIGVFSEKTAVLTDSDPFSKVNAVKDWYIGLDEGQKAHISASDAGIIALEQLNTLFDSFSPPVLTAQPAGGERVYGASDLTLTAAASGKDLSFQWYQNGELMPGKTETELLLPQNLPAGAYRYRCSVRAGRDGPETLSGEATVTVTPRPLTVRAVSHTVYIGDELPEFTAEYEGFAPNEGVSVLTGTLSFSCGADSSRAGTYAIELSGLTGENYQITFQPGTLIVLDAAPAPRESYVLPAPNGEEGWYTAPFTIAPAEGYKIGEVAAGPFTAGAIGISAETANGIKVIYLIDIAGKKYSAAVPYKLDSTPPALAWSGETAALESGEWYGSATVSAAGSDGLSGLGAVTLAVTRDGITQEMENNSTLSEAGTYSVAATAYDRAGNRAGLGAITLHVDPAIDAFVRKVELLDNTSSAEEIRAVRDWYDALTEKERDHIALSRPGGAALDALAALEAGRDAAEAFIRAVAEVKRPVTPEGRPAAEGLTARYDALGDALGRVPAETLRAYGEIASLLEQVGEAERLAGTLPGHLPGGDCAAAGDREAHAAAAEAAMLALGGLSGEGRGLAGPAVMDVVEGHYSALMEDLGHANSSGGVTVYGLAERVDTAGLTEGAPPEARVRVAVAAAPSLPEADTLARLEAELRAEEPSLVRAASYDVKLQASLVVGDSVTRREEVQPIEGQWVTVKFEIGEAVKLDSLRVYHVKGTDVRRVTEAENGLRIVTEGGKREALFEIGSFSHFLIYAEAERQPAPEPPPSAPGGGVERPSAGSGKVEEQLTPEFTDLEGHWAEAEMRAVLGLGLLEAEPGGAARPDRELTRGELAQALWRLAGSPPAGSAPFPDVPPELAAAAWTAERGVMVGTERGRFEPGRAVTRQEMAVVLLRYARLMGKAEEAIPDGTLYADAGEIPAWAEEGARFCQASGVITGRPGGRFAPGGTVTRAEAAVMLKRLMDRVL